MPKAAIDAGAACEVLPVDQMARVIAARFSA
jgi:chemotaxis response regulator CheB